MSTHTLIFHKMHALGNDFMVLDHLTTPTSWSSSQVRTWGCRRRGVGFDQMLVLEPPWHTEADFGYRILNADGQEVEQCVNGLRAMAVLVQRLGRHPSPRLRFVTHSGIHTTHWTSDDCVATYLDPPAWLPHATQVQLQTLLQDAPHGQSDVHAVGLSMGNPHVVLFYPDRRFDDPAVMERIAQFWHQQRAVFPDDVNVSMAHVSQSTTAPSIVMRTSERGAGATLACGSAAAAASAAAVQMGRIPRTQTHVTQPGGVLHTHVDGSGQLCVTGPASYVFRGQLDLPQAARTAHMH